MANTQILVKKSGSPGVSPTSLQHGELGLNYNDGKLYYTNSSNTISSIYTANSYSIISANSTLLIATSPSEILTINPSGAVVITTDVFSNILSIGVRQASTSQNGVVQLYSGTDSTSTILAATANSVYTTHQAATSAFDKANTGTIQAQAAFNKANSVVISITGTTNQITANSSTGSVLLSLPSSINVNSNSASSINLTANNSYSGNVYIGWSFNASGYNTLQSSANLVFTPSNGKLKSTSFVASSGLLENSNTIGTDYVINAGYNALSAGPITIANTVVVTIPSGSTWTIV